MTIVRDGTSAAALYIQVRTLLLLGGVGSSRALLGGVLTALNVTFAGVMDRRSVFFPRRIRYGHIQVGSALSSCPLYSTM